MTLFSIKPLNLLKDNFIIIFFLTNTYIKQHHKMG